MEIERKFLVFDVDFVEKYDKILIEQFYISLSPVIRARKFGSKFFLTVKGKGLLARKEFELEITEDEFLNLVPKMDLDTTIVKKTRHFIPLTQQLTAEVDLYQGELAGLATVEVEFNSTDEATAFVPPSWFGHEVTYDEDYSNVFLSKHGKPHPLNTP